MASFQTGSWVRGAWVPGSYPRQYPSQYMYQPDPDRVRYGKRVRKRLAQTPPVQRKKYDPFFPLYFNQRSGYLANPFGWKDMS